jgi:hypothetical protein
MLPVVEARSPHLTLIKRKTKRLDEVQNGATSETRTTSVAGVPVNFGMNKHDVRCQRSSSLQ